MTEPASTPAKTGLPEWNVDPKEKLAAWRKCQVDPHAKGSLFLSAMPGRHVALERFLNDVGTRDVKLVTCLAEEHELLRLNTWLRTLRRSSAGLGA